MHAATAGETATPGGSAFVASSSDAIARSVVADGIENSLSNLLSNQAFSQGRIPTNGRALPGVEAIVAGMMASTFADTTIVHSSVEGRYADGGSIHGR